LDAGLDVNRDVYGSVTEDIDGIGRPQGRYFDIGPYESTVITALHLTDPHLLAPIGGQLAYGKGYYTFLWEGHDALLDSIDELLDGKPPDIFVFSGDIVNWATNSESYQTILGETYTVTEWKDTYKGYLLLKEILTEHFNEVPIFETPENHDYREHPYFFWT